MEMLRYAIILNFVRKGKDFLLDCGGSLLVIHGIELWSEAKGSPSCSPP